MDELLRVLAEATSGLVEWAPNQLAPLVAMQTARFAATLPVFRAWMIVAFVMFPVGLVMTIIGCSVESKSPYESWSGGPAENMAVCGVILGLLGLIAGICLAVTTYGIVIEQKVFNAAPELYVLKALLGK